MYPPEYYQEFDRKRLLEVVKKAPLATVISQFEGKNHLCFIPFAYNDEQQVLLGHVMNGNPMTKQLANQSILLELVFNGSDCYISPSFFPRQTIPTWHYAKVCVKGNAHLVSDYYEKLSHMKHLTAFFEKDFETSWVIDQLFEKEVKAYLSQISVFYVKIEKMFGYFKLSQNKSSSFKKELKECLTKRNQIEDANLITDCESFYE